MPDLFEGFDDIYAEEPDWWEDPVDFGTFCTEHMHVTPTATQLSWFEELVGKDPKKVFKPDVPRTKKIRCILAGKGSGKDLISSLWNNYILYLLLCLRDPSKYFNMPPADSIDVVNCAQSADLALNVFFKRFVKRIKTWRWALERFKIYDSDRCLNPGVKDPRDSIKLNAKMLSCEKNPIRFHSLHSNAQGYEGLNILSWVLDEGSAFPTKLVVTKDGTKEESTADEIYRVCKSSSESRRWNWVGVLIAYPRSTTCFQSRMYKKGLDDASEILSGRYKQWECLPPNKYSGTYVEWEGEQIPLEYLQVAQDDPADFRLKYMCTALEEDEVFVNSKAVDEMFKLTRKEIAQVGEEIVVAPNGSKYLSKPILSWDANINTNMLPYVMAGDYSITSDRACITLAHGELLDEPIEGLDKKIVIDQLFVWQPNTKQQVLVSQGSLKQTVEDICYNLNIGAAEFDQLESALTIETLTLEAINVVKHNVGNDDYIRLRHLIHCGLVEVPAKSPFASLLELELKTLRYYTDRGKAGRGKIDHSDDRITAEGIKASSKDLADTLAACARLVYTTDPTLVPHNGLSREAPENFNPPAPAPSVNDWSMLIPGF